MTIALETITPRQLEELRNARVGHRLSLAPASIYDVW